MKRTFATTIICNCLYIINLYTLPGCTGPVQTRAVSDGGTLVKKYCSNCHLAPSPSLLDKKTWTEGILPGMAPYLGIEVLQGNVYLHSRQSAISHQDWTKIIAYYQTLAPDSLSAGGSDSIIKKESRIFDIKHPAADSSTISATILTVINPAKQHFYTSSLNNSGLEEWDKKFNRIRFTALKSAAVDVAFTNGSDIITSMGGMRALDNTIGEVVVSKRQGSKVTTRQLPQRYIRPVQSKPADLNHDGLTDLIISSFGHNQGGLYWQKQLEDHTYQKIAIREVAGATQSETGDFNGDGWLDIIALFAHGDEGIWIFLNDKKGGFVTKNIIRFPPVYGSSSFQLVDMNKDGRNDIIYTAGDNSDYSRILKPYHGLYVFLNTGNFRFRQAQFYPSNGCTKAMAADFDLDGDMDVATISFFADPGQKQDKKFLIFENVYNISQKRHFLEPTYIPVGRKGRWISMDVNDSDGDGDQDIILGNFSKGFMNQPDVKPDWDVHIPFVLLENNSKMGR